MWALYEERGGEEGTGPLKADKWSLYNFKNGALLLISHQMYFTLCCCNRIILFFVCSNWDKTSKSNWIRSPYGYFWLITGNNIIIKLMNIVCKVEWEVLSLSCTISKRRSPLFLNLKLAPPRQLQQENTAYTSSHQQYLGYPMIQYKKLTWAILSRLRVLLLLLLHFCGW